MRRPPRRAASARGRSRGHPASARARMAVRATGGPARTGRPLRRAPIRDRGMPRTPARAPPSTLRWMRPSSAALGRRSRGSRARARRSETVRLRGTASAPTSAQVAIRPISSQVPSTRMPSAAARAHMAAPRVGDVGLVVLAQHVHGPDDRGPGARPVPGLRSLRERRTPPRPPSTAHMGACHALGSISRPRTSASGLWPRSRARVRGGHGARPEAQVDHGVVGATEDRCRAIPRRCVSGGSPVVPRVGRPTGEGVTPLFCQDSAPPARVRTSVAWSHASHADPPPPRAERVEQDQPVTPLGRRATHRPGQGRGEAAAASCSPSPASFPTCCTPRCSAVRSRRRTSPSTRRRPPVDPVKRSRRLNERH